MSRVHSIAIVGAAGMIGSSILRALLETTQYKITVLTRSARSHQFPSSVTVVEVDYRSLESLFQALRGHDVLISALGKYALSVELLLVEAAFMAKVRRVIPSEFGGNLLNPKTRLLPNYSHKVIVQERLFELCRDGSEFSFSYTLVFNNILLDWSLSSGMVLDAAQHTLYQYDDGNTLFSTTRVSTVGRAVAAILEYYDVTANRAVYIHDMAITQNELISIISEEIGTPVIKDVSAPHVLGMDHSVTPSTDASTLPLIPKSVWNLRLIDTGVLEAQARKEIEAGESTDKLFYCFAVRAAFGPDYGGHFKRTDNDLLGLTELGRDGLREVIREALSRGVVGTN